MEHRFLNVPRNSLHYMDSYDPSVERRRREYVGSGVPLSTGSSQSSSNLMSLSGFIKLMSQTRIDGPYNQREVHLCGKHLGSGAQFDVYGHQHVANAKFPAFDQPFVSDRTMPATAHVRPVVVAVKRPKFVLSVGGYGLEPSPLNMGFGTPSQLHSLELEVLALCHESIRNHRNIVKLLAWGFELAKTVGAGVEPLSPILVLEHGNCSLREFLTNEDSIPVQVLQKLALDATQGLSVLHASGVIHGDLKTDNVLVFPDGQGPFFCVAKLSDFGLSIFDQKENVFNIGTPGWQAPELPSDEGIGAGMLAKCDFFSLGLLIFSIMFTHGGPPLRGSSTSLAFELARSSLMRSQFPSSVRNRIFSVLEYLLQHNPSERVSDLGNVCRLLEQLDEEFDIQGTWINGRFDDNTPWNELFLSRSGQTMVLGSQSRFKFLTEGLKIQDAVSYSWQEIHKFLCELPNDEYMFIAEYYMGSIDQIVLRRSIDENLSMEIVGQEVTGHQLLGLCFSDRLKLDEFGDKPSAPRVARRLRGSCATVAATKGYFPAQAVALQLLEDTSSKLLEKVHLNGIRWQWNAVSTGYILSWRFAHEYPEEHALALEHFRNSGGYNTHYIYTESKGHLRYDTSGLFHNPLGWLSAYPLHHAAVIGDVSEIERLLEDYGIDVLDASGETPLQRACMAGACSSVRCLIKNGADPTAKSKRLGTMPLHWLFVFEPKEVFDIATLLTSKGKSVLSEFSALKAEAFHFPFKWPVGTPLEWAVLSNRPEAVAVLLDLGSTLDSITDFFPGPPDWTKQIYGTNTRLWEHNSVDDPSRVLWRVWIYYSMAKFRLPIVQNNLSHQKQLESLGSDRGQRARQRNLHIFNSYGDGLITAVAENDFEAVRQLIGMGANVNAIRDKLGRFPTALATAIEQTNPDIVQLLLDNGAKFDGDYPGLTRPLIHAVSKQHMGVVKMLLDRGAEVNVLDSEEGTALCCAANRGSTMLVKLLLQYGADPCVQSEENPLEAAVRSNLLEVVELFLEKGSNPNTPGKNAQQRNALEEAALCGNAKILRALLDKGADPNIHIGHPYGTALQAAIIPDPDWKRGVVQLLLERGADATISGGYYGSLMQAAACIRDDVVAKMLLDAGAPVSIGGGPHGSALQAAVWSENLKLVQLLLDHGADPDFGGEDKWKTPLQVSVHREDEKQVELLLRRGADPNIQGSLDGNALKTAEKSGNTKIIQMLLDWGAQDESEPDRWDSMLDRVGTPPLSHPDVSCARFLLARCFERYAQSSPGALSSINLANRIIDFAGYWLADLSQRHHKAEVSNDTQDTPYLQVKIKDWPSPDTRVRQVVFRIKSRDTAAIKIPGLHRGDPYQNSHTWFEARVHSSDTAPSQPHIVIQKNFCGSLTIRTHNITWDLNNNDPQILRFLSSLKPGDVVDVYAKVRTGKRSYVNYVDSVEVIVLYGHTKDSIPQPPVTEASRREPDPTPIQTKPSPQEILGTLEEPSNGTETETTIGGTPMPKEATIPKRSAGFFDKIVKIFISCFK